MWDSGHRFSLAVACRYSLGFEPRLCCSDLRQAAAVAVVEASSVEMGGDANFSRLAPAALPSSGWTIVPATVAESVGVGVEEQWSFVDQEGAHVCVEVFGAWGWGRGICSAERKRL